MTLQQKTLQRYRQFFPNETLRETSARTSIQITRVFRLFNGKIMKVGELEAFEKAINEKILENPSFLSLSSTMEDALSVLSNDEISKITEYIRRKIAARTFSKTYIGQNYQSAIIA